MTNVPAFWKQRRQLSRWLIRLAVKVDGFEGTEASISHRAPTTYASLPMPTGTKLDNDILLRR